MEETVCHGLANDNIVLQGITTRPTWHLRNRDKIYLAFQKCTVKPLCQNRMTNFWYCISVSRQLSLCHPLACKNDCSWHSFSRQETVSACLIKTEVNIRAWRCTATTQFTILSFPDNEGSWIQPEYRCFAAMHSPTVHQLNEGTHCCAGNALTLYTVPKAPEPRTLTRFSSVSFRIRSCAWLGAVPLGVKGSTSYEGKSNNLKYLKMWRRVRCLYCKQPIQLNTGIKTAVGSIDHWPANLWRDFSHSKANAQCYETKRPDSENPHSTCNNFHQELHDGITNWKLNWCHNNTPKDFC